MSNVVRPRHLEDVPDADTHFISMLEKAARNEPFETIDEENRRKKAESKDTFKTWQSKFTPAESDLIERRVIQIL